MAHNHFLLISSIFLSSIFFIAFSSPTPPPSPSPELAPPYYHPPVMDVNGNKLRVGKGYYVMSRGYSRPSGLCQSSKEVVQCPMKSSKKSMGLPVSFIPNSGDDEDEEKYVRENMFYNVEFAGGDDEDEGEPEVEAGAKGGGFWKLKKGHEPGQKIVTVSGGGSSKKKKGLFSLRRIMMGYKLVYCAEIPTPGEFIRCYPLGFTMDEESSKHRLGIGLGMRPVQFYFKKNSTRSGTDDDNEE